MTDQTRPSERGWRPVVVTLGVLPGADEVPNPLAPGAFPGDGVRGIPDHEPAGRCASRSGRSPTG